MTKEQQDADLVLQMMKTPGWKVVVKRMAEKQETYRRAWLNQSNPADAEHIRQESRGISACLREVATILKLGKVSLPPQKEQGEPNGK